MGLSIAGAVISAAATVYGAQQQNKAAYDAAVRQNEQLKQQYASDAARQKQKTDALAAQASRDEVASRQAVESDSAKRAALAQGDTTEDSSATLLTGSEGVKNAFRRKATLTGSET